MHYLIEPRSPNTDPIRVEPADLHQTVSDLSGRPGILSVPSIQKRLGQTGRVYIAARAGRPGFIVRRHVTPDAV